jgi:chromosome segregation protein
LDEVDAALDEANVGRFRDVLRTLAAQTQFIVITHNRTTIESANAVYGITMSEDGVSQAISLRLDVNGNGKNGTPTSADERG